MNYRIVSNILGKVLLAEAALMALPLLTALICGEAAFPFPAPSPRSCCAGVS